MSSFLASGLGTWGGEVFPAEGGDFRSAEAGLPKPKGGLRRPPTPVFSAGRTRQDVRRS